MSLVFEEPPEDLLIVSDEGKISQILRNLISNALKFTEHGEVRVCVSCEKGQSCFLFRTLGLELRPTTRNVSSASLPKLKIRCSEKSGNGTRSSTLA